MKIDPIDDINQILNYHKKQGRKIKIVRINKTSYNQLLDKTGCKNSDELIAEHKKKYPHVEDYIIKVLED